MSDLIWLLRWLKANDEASIQVFGTPLRALRNLSHTIQQAEA